MAAAEVMDIEGEVPRMAVRRDDTAKDLFKRLKELQRKLEFLEIQEEYVKDEMKHLKGEYLRAQEE
eukprot:CAMPEP_0113877388 /NCGR_PEP_ID=MMETSP0780_2-20120614/6066_1 /TAXON_ID=652834 /ORGANISM="Palpitomonas bilix" /LENGTH=65 /DNA_ID=CAMNT_0000863675 /DNA_START=104 /DNA_END=298 /DNA_ORIENTATION=+ /assembly_acc=CAM_ASM_000599